MSGEQIAWSPRWWDWLAFVSIVVSLVLTLPVFGIAGVVVYALLLFAAYRLGKALGR